MFDCAPGVMTGKSQLSYCTRPETLKSERNKKSPLRETSLNVAPPGIKSLLTF
jgi:hypothetical protein